MGGARDRQLTPLAFAGPRPGVRQLRALLAADDRELANVVYGVYRRAAFEDLLAGWERVGDAFGGPGHRVGVPAAGGRLTIDPTARSRSRRDRAERG